MYVNALHRAIELRHVRNDNMKLNEAFLHERNGNTTCECENDADFQ